MNRTTLLAISAVAVLGLAGCGTSGGIIPAASSKSEFDGAVYKGQTTVVNEKSITGVEYRIFNQGATGYTSNAANREDAEVRATAFCKGRDKEYRLLHETVSTPPYLLGNFPRVELVFECVEPKLTTSTTPQGRGITDRLKEAEDLFKSGVITKPEYEQKRQEILKAL